MLNAPDCKRSGCLIKKCNWTGGGLWFYFYKVPQRWDCDGCRNCYYDKFFGFAELITGFPRKSIRLTDTDLFEWYRGVRSGGLLVEAKRTEDVRDNTIDRFAGGYQNGQVKALSRWASTGYNAACIMFHRDNLCPENVTGFLFNDGAFDISSLSEWDEQYKESDYAAYKCRRDEWKQQFKIKGEHSVFTAISGLYFAEVSKQFIFIKALRAGDDDSYAKHFLSQLYKAHEKIAVAIVKFYGNARDGDVREWYTYDYKGWRESFGLEAFNNHLLKHFDAGE